MIYVVLVFLVIATAHNTDSVRGAKPLSVSSFFAIIAVAIIAVAFSKTAASLTLLRLTVARWQRVVLWVNVASVNIVIWMCADRLCR
ncbi:hypothetical protein B0T26DRAFT_717318 [Lasiosphaeria miniovina]|uniref:Uncharacterized protein n=1 Tax=Lasiosphaeria miniovina TaxID=1954250 RepID=A0AA40ACL2_9PEZI|nr:uncharacterized protein B0T26DRAFT_717318 [Lasiosphaeria miniovina]KAK0713393.1 hypothetical protein B0T26DRAFT_717318 [Lasiosphaeria miniovina]